MNPILDIFMFVAALLFAFFLLDPEVVVSSLRILPSFLMQVSAFLTWQVTVLIIFFTFLHHRNFFIKFIRSIKFGSLSIEFGQEMETIAEVSRDIEPNYPEIYDDRIPAELLSLAKISPRSAVLQTWIDVEKKLGGVKSTDTKFFSVANAISALFSNKKITSEDYHLFNKLKDIRNKVVHAGEQEINIQFHDFIEYWKSSQLLVDRIMSAG